MRLIAAFLFASLAATGQSTYQPFAWRNVNLQGMGFVTVLTIHPKAPHDIYAGTDVGGAYRYDRAADRWIPITDRIGTEGPGSYGIEALAVDPTNVNVVYAAMPYRMSLNGTSVDWAGEIVVSRDRGAFWSPTGLARHNVYMGPNDDLRGLVQDRLAVDPHQPTRLYYATRRHGLWIGDVAASTWRRAGGALPESTEAPGITFVAVDPSATDRIYAGVYTSGVWRSNDGGDSWTQIDARPNPVRAAIDKAGVLYVSYGRYSPTAGALRRWRNGEWAEITPAGRTNLFWAGVAVDPSDPATILAAADGNLTVYRSTDRGAQWTRIAYSGIGLKQPGYFQKPNSWNFQSPSGGWGNAGLAIDPANPRQAWQTNGYGVMRNNDVTATGSNWEWVQNNLEELVPQRVVVPPAPGGADLFLVAMDMVGFRVENRDRPPDSKIAEFQWVAQGNSMAFAGQAPENMAFVGWDQVDNRLPMTGVSGDNGRTWRPFENATPGIGGNIAVSARDPRNMVWAPAKGSTPVFTKDGGKTWQKAKVGGEDLRAGWQLTGSEWWASQVLAADPIEEGRFYYYFHASWNSPGELFLSNDGGASWTLAGTVREAGRPVGNTVKVNLVPNPTRAGDLWLAHSRNTNQTGRFVLLRSQDAGVTWTPVPGLQEVRFVTFGRGNSETQPFLYVFGLAPGDGNEAMYKSEDLGATWIRISDPGQIGFAGVTSIAGDMRVKDLVYAAVGGRGVFYGQRKEPAFTAEGVANAASYATPGVTPGENIVIFGTGIGPDVLAESRATTIAGGTQILFDGIPAPMLYASATQSSALVPFHTAGRESATMQVLRDGIPSAPVVVPVVAAKPGIYTANRQGSGPAILVDNATGAVNGPANSFPRGTDVFFYVTGAGQTSPPGTDGASNDLPLPVIAREVTVSVGGVTVPAQWAGGAPFFVQGLTQVNFRIPAGAPVGEAVPLRVTVGGVTSAGQATISIR
ncbi:MAG TPA: hypothetical protein DEH78_30070 [Solibacterales bacterium]|nr:hypothetical protein [Bryobacterales bacterium]